MTMTPYYFRDESFNHLTFQISPRVSRRGDAVADMIVQTILPDHLSRQPARPTGQAHCDSDGERWTQ